MGLTLEGSDGASVSKFRFASSDRDSISLTVPGRDFPGKGGIYESDFFTTKVGFDDQGTSRDMVHYKIVQWQRPEPVNPVLPVVTVVASDDYAGEPDNPGAFTLRRTGNTDSALTVRYSLSGSAVAGDYILQNAINAVSASIPAGAASAQLVVSPLDDADEEPVETVVLALANDADYAMGTPASATVNLYDNDVPAPPPGGHAGTMSGYLSATCSDGYSDGSQFNVAIDAAGTVTGDYDWGKLTGAVRGDFMSVQLLGDWSDCVFGGNVSGSGNSLTGQGTVSCTGSGGCSGSWSGN